MKRADIELLLNQAKLLTNHSHFVIIGSLSILGAAERPPESMTLSIDVDLYPRDDPGRVSEMACHLGLGSAFEEEHGFYADPVSPRLASLPEGWESRMIPIQFPSGVTAWFIEPNDAAVSKYVRSEPRDRAWIRGGLSAGILSMPTIEYRLRETYADDREIDLAKQSIKEDQVWLAEKDFGRRPDRQIRKGAQRGNER
ncbi:conserved hypothetical protein [Thiomonas sp. CB3]|jgi:hypothetical protein|nr:conserved hypothetical protein [Thiomonas sp. CB3]